MKENTVGGIACWLYISMKKLCYNTILGMPFPFPNKPVFTPSQLERFSNIFDNAGQVALATGVASPLFSGFDKIDIGVVALAMSIVSLCWTLSVWLAKRKDV